MAFSTGSTVAWSDVQAIYNSLNTARTKFGFSTVSVPSNPGSCLPSQVSALNNSIQAMSSSGYVGSNANTGITIPASGTLLYPGIFNTMKNTISTVQGLCKFDSFNSSFDGFSSCFFAENSCDTFHSSSSFSTANSFST